MLPGFEVPGFEVPRFEPGFEAPGLDPGFEVPGFFDPLLGEVPEFGGDAGVFEPGVAAPGVLGFVPWFGLLFGSFGFAASGALGFVGFDPGVALPAGGIAVPPVGGCVVLPVGGCTAPVGGADGDVWPGVAEPAGGALPAGACCATTQVAQNKSTDNSVSFLGDIMRPPALSFPAGPWSACGAN